jgi:hypothetical protein
MEKHKIQIGKSFVYAENISVHIHDVYSKFIWFGHVFYLPHHEKEMFIPAGKDWKWLLDQRDVSNTSITLKLIGAEQSKSYLAIHYEKDEPAPHPINYALSVPEFSGNYLSITTEDSYCREKSLLHCVSDVLFIDHYKINFVNLNSKSIEVVVNEEMVN